MADTVTISSKLAAPATPGVGRILSSLTVVLKNQSRVTKDTLTYPVGITQSYAAETGYTYTITDYDVSDKDAWPGTYVIAVFTGVDQESGQSVTWSDLFTIGDVEEIPETPDERAPYLTVAEALERAALGRQFAPFRDLAAANPADAHRLLIEASDAIDTERYIGEKAALNAGPDTRQWPRVFAANEATYILATATGETPGAILQAVLVQANWVLEQEAAGHDWQARREMQLRGLTGVTRGRSSESWDNSMAYAGELCQAALRLVNPYLARVAGNFPVSSYMR